MALAVDPLGQGVADIIQQQKCPLKCNCKKSQMLATGLTDWEVYSHRPGDMGPENQLIDDVYPAAILISPGVLITDDMWYRDKKLQKLRTPVFTQNWALPSVSCTGESEDWCKQETCVASVQWFIVDTGRGFDQQYWTISRTFCVSNLYLQIIGAMMGF